MSGERTSGPTLFLGGPANGRRLDVPPGAHSYVVPVPQPPELIDYVNEARAESLHPSNEHGLTTITYVRKRLGFARAEIAVSIFAPSGWTDVDLDYALAKWIESGA